MFKVPCISDFIYSVILSNMKIYLKMNINQHGFSCQIEKMIIFSMIDIGTYICCEPKNRSRYSVFRDQFLTVLIDLFFKSNRIR